MSLDRSPPPPPSAPLTLREKLLGPAKFVLRGLAIALPTVLTIVILIWVLWGVNTYVIYPATAAMKWALAQKLDESVDSQPLVKLPAGPELEHAGRNYLVTADLRDLYRQQFGTEARTGPDEAGDWLATQEGLFVPFGRRAVPYEHYLVVARELPARDMPVTATGIYMEYAAERSFGSLFQLSLVAIILILVILYFLGRLVTIRLGHWIVSRFESGVLGRLPVIRNVYGSVKQVTDFLFSESQVEYRRVVAIEYPRRGIWSLAFVTGDAMLDITTAVGEPCVTVLVFNSPIPLTGFTICLPRSHVLDLNITVEHAMNFGFSCGVLVPPHQRVTPELLRQHLEKRLAEEFLTSGTTRSKPTRSTAAGGPDITGDE
jgi:uncharacterized membrane protein